MFMIVPTATVTFEIDEGTPVVLKCAWDGVEKLVGILIRSGARSIAVADVGSPFGETVGMQTAT